MNDTEIMIILQNCNTAAATITASLPCQSIEEAAQVYSSAYELVSSTVMGKITEQIVDRQMPGAQIVDITSAPGYPQPGGPSNGGQAVSAFPQAQPGPGPQGWDPNQQQQVPPPAQFNPAANVYQGPPQAVQTSNPAEADWTDLFNNWSDWYDNRVEKKSDKHPDFRHKSRKGQNGYNIGLYLNRAPDWAKQRLGSF